MAVFLGFDTSNYRTSAAYYDSQQGSIQNAGQLLEVPDGKIGLRQSDALFQHITRIADQVKQLPNGIGGRAAAIGVSTRPRAVDGSYMPCFLAGTAVAECCASLLGIPCYPFSHQQGHIAAAAFSAHALDLLKAPFYAWHLSGGTTELLRVTPDDELGIAAECIGGSLDISAGQLIDRAGQLLNLHFPAGPELENLSNRCIEPVKFYPVRVKDGWFSLSGMENKAKDMQKKGAAQECIARFIILTIANAVGEATKQAMRMEKLPLLCAGGVMANRYLQDYVKQFHAYCASPELSGDNAAGAAILASMKTGLEYA